MFPFFTEYTIQYFKYFDVLISILLYLELGIRKASETLQKQKPMWPDNCRQLWRRKKYRSNSGLVFICSAQITVITYSIHRSIVDMKRNINNSRGMNRIVCVLLLTLAGYTVDATPATTFITVSAGNIAPTNFGMTNMAILYKHMRIIRAVACTVYICSFCSSVF